MIGCPGCSSTCARCATVAISDCCSLGQLVSLLGSNLTVVAVPYQVYRETHSSLWVGLASLYPTSLPHRGFALGRRDG